VSYLMGKGGGRGGRRGCSRYPKNISQYQGGGGRKVRASISLRKKVKSGVPLVRERGRGSRSFKSKRKGESPVFVSHKKEKRCDHLPRPERTYPFSRSGEGARKKGADYLSHHREQRKKKKGRKKEGTILRRCGGGDRPTFPPSVPTKEWERALFLLPIRRGEKTRGRRREA